MHRKKTTVMPTCLETQLCKAVSDGEPRAVKTLLSEGANPNLLGNTGVAAVHLAVGKESEKNTRCLKHLLQHGADPNVRTTDGLTPLHVAALWGCHQNLKLLLKNGGNPNVKDQDGNKPGDLAQQQDNRKCALLLQEYQSSSLETEDEDIPQFQYSVYNDQSDTSSYAESEDCSVSSHDLSLLSDFGDGPLSSTRCSSLFDLSAKGNRQSWRGGTYSRPSDINPNVCHNQTSDINSDWGEGALSVLSSTRMSVAGSRATLPILQEGFEEGPLSSTRCSSLFDLSARGDRQSWRGGPYSRPSDITPNVCHNQTSDINSDWGAEPLSVLSSTRMSVAGSRATLPILREDMPLTDCSVIPHQDVDPLGTGKRFSPSTLEALPSRPSRRTSRKSVSFKDMDEYFPVFSPESPRERRTPQASPCSQHYTVDFSEYSDFLDSDRMATVLHRQGIDVTSPDHVFVFSRDANECTEDDMEKTVIGHFPLEEENENERVDEIVQEAKAPERPACSTDSSSGTSQYSSCESDHYISALEPCLHPRQVSPSEDGEGKVKITGDQAVKEPYNPMDLSATAINTDGFIQGIPSGSTETQKYSILSEVPEELPAMLDNLTLSDENAFPGASGGGVMEVATDPAVCTPKAGAVAVSEEEFDRPFTPSPFVTGRTRSRLSRCSMRTAGTLESPLSTSSLFEQTLPTPTRTQRRTNTKSHSSDGVSYGTPGRCHTPVFSGSSTGSTSGDFVNRESQETQSSTFRAGSCVSASQADTFILPCGSILTAGSSVSASQADTLIICRSKEDMVNVPQTFPQTLTDTVILERSEEGGTSTDSFENHHLDRWPAHLIDEMKEAYEFMTDDLSSLSDAVTKEGVRSTVQVEPVGSFQRTEESCAAEETGSSSSSLSSSQTTSSSSSYFSPKRSRDDTPSTPGTGCTPRYSMSRLSALHRPRSLANLSYTPGGRPLIQDLEEPVEYLYTDSEQGHELIETHVPPTANTSLSSSMSSSTNEDTVLYDWRSMEGGPAKGKENHQPADEWSEATKGVTDRELRRRLVELGESPGPISSRTRPVYMQRLRRLMLEPRSQPQEPDQPQQTVTSGHSAELCRALRTFELPDCHADELELCQQFDQPDQNRKWREGVIKSSFNYLLLDPRVTKNLPYRSRSMTPQECFQTFCSSIFYVGKGKRSRPYSHLYEALEYYRGDKTSKKLCSKVQHILQVWKAEQGVVSLHCFQNVIPVEAYTREACMVDAIGLKMLTNQKRGDFYGVVSTWQAKRKRDLGVHLLYRAMQIFLAEGERQLRPADIRAGQ